MKRKILSLVLVFAMTVSLFTVGTGAVEPTYGDTAGHWAESAIERWSDHGIIQGSKGAFDPDGQLTCGQLATILAKLLKLPAAKDAGFTDNTANAWYYDAINRCAASGILNGNGDGTVTPEAPITRERAMVMLGRALGIEPISNPDLTKYVDAAQVSTYARGYVAALIETGIVGGVAADQLAPQDDINRASTVTILDRAIAVYADEDGQTIDASKVNGLILIAAKNVTVKDAPKGTSVLVCKDASGATVNGKAVDAGTSVTAEEAQPVKPTTGGGSSGGSTPSHSNLIVTESKTVSGGTYQNVTITDAVGDGEVTLTGLTIRGDLAIKGGGSNSIKLIDCIIQGKIILNKLIPEGAQQPRLELTNTPARKVEVQSPAIVEATDENSKIDTMEVKDDLTIKGDKTAVDAITVPAGASPEVNVKDGSKVDKIEAKGTTTVKTTSDSVVGTIAAESDLNVSGNINAITVPETANDSVNIAIGSGTTVPEVTVNSDKGTTISGEGTVSNIAASSDAAKGSISGDKVDPSAIADHVHTWNAGTVTAEAGCSSTGTKTYTCTVDGCNASKLETLPVLGHKWGSWEKVDETNHKRVCASDASHIETAEHSWDTGVITNAATCTEKGIKTYTCTICSAGKPEDVDALGHDFAADFTVDKAATCTEAGSKSKHCSRCDAKDAVTEIPATGHTFAAEWSKDTDCHWHAATCGHTAEVKDKAEHSWNSGVVTTPATTTTAGVKTYTCTVCNATKTETIPAEGAEAVAAATGVTIDQSGVCIRVTIEQPADTSHIASYQVNLYNSTDKSNRHADRPGCSVSSGRAWFGYWDALYTDFDKIEVISVAEDGYANATWTGDIFIAAMEAGTLSYELNYNTAQKYLEATLTTAPANASYRVINEGYKNGWENYTADGNTIKLRSTGDGSIKDGTNVSIGAWTLDKCEKDSAGEWQIAYTVYPVGAEVTANIPHVHEWDKGEITTEPTSSVDGVRTYTCSGCGEKKTETVSKDRVCNIRFEKDGGRFQLVWDAPLNADSLSQPEYNVYLKKDGSWIKISGTDQTLLRYPVDEAGDYTAVRVETTTEKDNIRTALTSREQAVDFKVSFTTGGAPTSVTWSKNAKLTAEWNMPAYDERVTGVTPNVWGKLQLRTSDGNSGHSSGTLTDKYGVWTSTSGSDNMEECLASGKYRFLEYLNASVSADGLTASYTVNQRGDWTACSGGSTTEDEKNGYDIEWTVIDNLLRAKIVVPDGSDKNQTYTIYVYNSETKNYDALGNLDATGFAFETSFKDGTYDRVRLYAYSEDSDFSEQPLADWALPKKIVSSNGTADFPSTEVLASVTPREAGGYVITFSGLDLDTYAYMLYNSSNSTSTFLRATELNDEQSNFIGEGINLYALSASETESEISVFRSKPYSVDITAPSESTAKAWINATASALQLKWTPKDGYTGLYYVNGTNVGSGTTYSLINTVRNAAQSAPYSFAISTKEDASSNTLTPYVTLENALTVSIDATKTPDVTIKGLEDGNYKFVSNNSFAGMYDYDLCAPDGSVIYEWWVKADGTAPLAPYKGCKFKVRELSWDETGEELSTITVSASAEGNFGFEPLNFSELNVSVTDEESFSTAVNKGGKVTLANNITITNTRINRGGDVEIDLNGHTLDLGDHNALSITKAVKFTNSSEDQIGTIAGTSGISCGAGSKLDLNGITVARITDAGKMRGITIENCTVTYLIQLTDANTMHATNTVFSCSNGLQIYQSTALFDGCKFNGGSDQNILQLNGDTNVTLDNATFSGGKVSFVRSNNNLILKRGTYCFDPTEYVLADDYTVAHDEGSSVWTVSASTSA